MLTLTHFGWGFYYPLPSADSYGIRLIVTACCQRQQINLAPPEARQRERGVKAGTEAWPSKMAIIHAQPFVSGHFFVSLSVVANWLEAITLNNRGRSPWQLKQSYQPRSGLP